MKNTIDLSALVQNLREAPASPMVPRVKKWELNPYLVETLLPILRADRLPRFSELDFGAFDADDLPDLCGYLEEKDRSGYSLAKISQVFCGAAPSCAKTRAFL